MGFHLRLSLDIVLRIFVDAAEISSPDVTEEDLVQLENVIRRQLDIFEVLVDGPQGIPVARDLLLGAVPRRRLLLDELLEASVRRADALDGVARLGRLHLCDLDQPFELLWLLREVRLLSAFRLVYAGDEVDHLTAESHVLDLGIIEVSPLSSLSFFIALSSATTVATASSIFFCRFSPMFPAVTVVSHRKKDERRTIRTSSD